MKEQLMQECSSCGELFAYEAMEHINTGRKVQHLCPECYKQGMAVARYREIMRGEHSRRKNKK